MTHESRAEYTQNVVIADAAIPNDIEEQIDNLVMRELSLTDTAGHDKLMGELISHINNNEELFST